MDMSMRSKVCYVLAVLGLSLATYLVRPLEEASSVSRGFLGSVWEAQPLRRADSSLGVAPVSLQGVYVSDSVLRISRHGMSL